MEVLLAEALLLRPLSESEIPALARGLVETSEAQVANRWREQELGYRELLVAELDGQLVGTVSISEPEGPWRQPGGQAGSLHLFALEVAPALRDRGVGGAIVSGVLEEARRRGRRRVFLEVRVDNPARLPARWVGLRQRLVAVRGGRHAGACRGGVVPDGEASGALALALSRRERGSTPRPEDKGGERPGEKKQPREPQVE